MTIKFYIIDAPEYGIYTDCDTYEEALDYCQMRGLTEEYIFEVEEEEE